VPVIVDAAAELPPKANLSWFTEQGADLVAFSGGKGIRGPQTTGILAGRADLIESVAAQHLDTHATESVWDPPERLLDADRFDGVPRQGVGRPLKVGKEELVGLLAALDAFLEADQDALGDEWRERAEGIAGDLDAVDGLATTIEGGAKSVAPTVSVAVDAERAGVSAADLVLALRREDPRVFVGADGVDDGTVTVSLMCLTDDEAEYVVERVRANLAGEAGD
jgi:D-glucosaminate-6-phosphate ammonia-lyase